MTSHPRAPVVLIVLDGWGIRAERAHNAIAMARKPVFDELMGRYPHAQLIASGEAVGLPAGQMGNSEVGHMNMGAGRVVYQDLTRIDKSIRDGDLFASEALTTAMDRVRRRPPRTPLHRSLVGRWGPQPPAALARAHRHGRAPQGAAGLRPRDYRRARHLTDGRDPVLGRARGCDASRRRRTNRHCRRALLRDGSRQAVGADEAGATTRS